jgi:hypothetical protein
MWDKHETGCKYNEPDHMELSVLHGRQQQQPQENDCNIQNRLGSQTALHGKSAMMVDAVESATVRRLNNDKSATGGQSMCLECHIIL